MPENNLLTLTLNEDQANMIPLPGDKFIFFNEKCAIVCLISQIFVFSGPINNMAVLVRMMAWH